MQQAKIKVVDVQPTDAEPSKLGDAPQELSGDSRELADVMYRATLIRRRYHEQLLADGVQNEHVDLTFTSVLLGFIASNIPLGRWFDEYTRNAKVAVDEMRASQKLDTQTLDAIRSAEFDPEVVRKPSRRSWVRHMEYGAAGMSKSIHERMQPPLWPSATLADYYLSIETEGAIERLPWDARHLMAAYIYRWPAVYREERAAWRFNQINWSNAFLSYISSDSELRERELKRWIEIHRETFKKEPNIPPPAPTKLAPPDITPLHLDNPSDADYLGRRGFAEAMARRLNRVWRQCNPGGKPSDKSDVRSSFVLHMHGPWGSGKTSLLNFLRKELQPAPEAEKLSLIQSLRRRLRPPRVAWVDNDEKLRWVVVEFNAWQHQRLNPPWWPLLDTVYTRSCRQLADAGLFGERRRAWAVRLRERWWRLNTGRKDYLLTTVFAFALAALLFWLTRASGVKPPGADAASGGDASDAVALVKSVVTYASVVVGVWSSVLLVSRSLISGSARSAQAFMETAGDPMERVCAHFRELIEWIGEPVVIFIDDLDRCQPKYVVDLLEGIQTLFSDPRVTYVIAADRRWLNTCFETAYQNFADAVREPGRRLGSLFLEKAFELSVSVPLMSGEMKQVYWDYLVGGAQENVEQVFERESAEVGDEFADAETEEQVFARLQVKTGNRLRDQVRNGAAVRRLAEREVVSSTTYFLMPFAPLLEPNPRAMKRLVNAYSVLRDMALLAGVDVLGDIARRRQLALWAIVSLRWPLLEEYLENNLEAIDSIRDGKMREGSAPLIPDEGLQKLAESQDVQNVFKGGQTKTGLMSETVREIVRGGRANGDAQPASAPVA